MIAEFMSEKVEKVALPLLKEMAVELVELNIHRHKGEVIIQMLADKQRGGISIAECTELNRKIVFAIESQGLLTEPFSLEVSSPGLDRPLKTLKDFRRVLGRRVRFFLSEPVGDRREYSGEIKHAGDAGVLLSVDGVEVSIPLDKINNAKQVI